MDISEGTVLGTVTRVFEHEKNIAFTVLAERKWQDKTFKVYHQCVAFSDALETLRGLSEGDRVYVRGDLQAKSRGEGDTKTWGLELVARTTEIVARSVAAVVATVADGDESGEPAF